MCDGYTAHISFSIVPSGISCNVFANDDEIFSFKLCISSWTRRNGKDADDCGMGAGSANVVLGGTIARRLVRCHRHSLVAGYWLRFMDYHQSYSFVCMMPKTEYRIEFLCANTSFPNTFTKHSASLFDAWNFMRLDSMSARAAVSTPSTKRQPAMHQIEYAIAVSVSVCVSECGSAICVRHQHSQHKCN